MENMISDEIVRERTGKPLEIELHKNKKFLSQQKKLQDIMNKLDTITCYRIETLGKNTIPYIDRLHIV